MNKAYNITSQVYLKWMTANKNLMKFNDIYMNAIRNLQIGANEVCPNETKLPSQLVNLLNRISGLTSTTEIHMKLQLIIWYEITRQNKKKAKRSSKFIE
ncbi:unnamed protein product [Lactuca saligna]|uniref:Uncharacterized protein n=1 Tax=Lactuca saligna TaxID=75948 RepID=A0AA35W0J7_LACSI|nr:unnamed protein product [Lactuca saligna]